ncbi:MAG: hypothetical protein SGPRY_004613 [Prymnesium sp.]
MGRPKAVPLKRPRSEGEGEAVGRVGVGSVEELTPRLIEQAEAALFRSRIADGSIELLTPSCTLPRQLNGFCRGTVEREELTPLRELHDTICHRLRGSLARWGGIADDSGRMRGYGFLPGTSGESHFGIESSVGGRSLAMREFKGEQAAADRQANLRASLLLSTEDLPPNTRAARLLPTVSTLGRRYRQLLSREHLIAAQPNLHNGRELLRPHLDEALHDGFGIVIVTVAMRGTWDPEQRRDFCFPLPEGDAYVLCADVRNTCLHGVLADVGSEHRASLNLRFGLHSAERDAEFSAWREIDRHWPETRDLPIA